jgi:hypothetical protein
MNPRQTFNPPVSETRRTIPQPKVMVQLVGGAAELECDPCATQKATHVQPKRKSRSSRSKRLGEGPSLRSVSENSRSELELSKTLDTFFPFS